MSGKFGVPTETAVGNRSFVEERLKAAVEEQGAKVTVQWRGEPRHLYVISMPIAHLYLNPATHRLRVQLTLDPERKQELDDDPWGKRSQEYLADLLKRNPAKPTEQDPDYAALMRELQEFGQREPGIITREGILVDGNTRCAALRDISVTEIRVGVLPPDADWMDLNDVELGLQLRKDTRRPYTYINQLIAIEEQLNNGRSARDVAGAFNIKESTLQKDRWVYALIQEAIDRSRAADGSALRLIDFENHQEKLREIYTDYVKLQKRDPDAAERLKETRLAMVVLNYPKTTVRLAGHDFHTRYLEPRLPARLKPTVEESTDVSIPGLDIEVPDADADAKAARALTDTLLQASAVRAAKGSDLQAADKIVQEAREAFKTANRMAGQNAELTRQQHAVPDRLTTAATYISQATGEFAEAKAKRALDEEAFDDALLTLRASLASLAKQAARAFDTPGDGVEWLLKATREP